MMADVVTFSRKLTGIVQLFGPLLYDSTIAVDLIRLEIINACS